MRFSLKKVKIWDGSEGPGCEADLLVDGQHAAHIANTGNGDAMEFQWRSNVIERKVLAHIAKLPVELVAKNEPDHEMYPRGRKVDLELFMCRLLDDRENRRRLAKVCEQKTVYRLDGDPQDEYRTLDTPYPASKAGLLKKYGGKITILNETA